MKKYYIIYKTTNKLNNKIYIGQHTTNDLNDNYLGSGTSLLYAIKKYGKHNFTREILFIYDNFEEMNNKEKEIVTEAFVKRKDNYNIALGGGDLSNCWSSNSGQITINDNGINYNISVDDPRYLSGELNSVSKGRIAVYDNDGNLFKVFPDDPRYLSGELIRKPYKRPKKVRIYKDDQSKSVTPTAVHLWESKGWKLGSAPRKKKVKMVSINDGVNNKSVGENKLEEWLEKGWVLGKLKLKKITIIKDGVTKRVNENKLEEWLEKGFVKKD